jgi:hypothetical protein
MQTVEHGRRSTRRARQREARRHTYKQRGGADWAPDFSVAPYSDRYDEWVQEISNNPVLLSLFPKLIVKDKKPIPRYASEKLPYLKTYINCLAHQNKLFGAALNIIKKKIADELGLPQDSISDINTIKLHATSIDDKKPQMIEYFKDVERMVMFAEDTEGKLPKLRAMYEDNTYSSLSTLLLFPSRIENVFIIALSEIICNLMDDRSILTEASTESLQLILATQYDSYAQALAHTLTAFPLRDGFYLNQGLEEIAQLSMREGFDGKRRELENAIDTAATDEDRATASKALSDFTKQETFWKKFVVASRRVLETTTTINDLFNNKTGPLSRYRCKSYIADNTFADITADMLMYAIINKDNIDNMDIIKLLANSCKQIVDSFYTIYSRSILPPDDFLHIGISGGVTLKTLLSNVDIATLEYLLHLQEAIKECWKRRHP